MDKFTEQGCRNLYDGNGNLLPAVAIEQKDFGVITEVVDLEGESVYRILRAMNSREEMLEALKEASQFVKLARQYFPKSIQNSATFKLNSVCAQIGTAIFNAERGE